jgi:hypothetical protein
MRSKAIALDLASLAVLIGAVLFVTAPFLSNRVVPFAADEGGSDLLDLNIPHRLLLWEGIRSGELPVWRSDISTGFPLLAEAQTGIFDPLQYLVFRTLPFVLAFNLRLVLALLTMAIGTFYYAKRVGQGQLGATVAALAFTLSGYSLGHFKHVQILEALAYFPWLLLATEHLVRRPAFGSGAGLAAALGLSFLAGHLPTTVFLAFGATVYFFTRLASDAATARERPAVYWMFGAGLAAGSAVAAVQLLPSLAFLSESTRQVASGLIPISTFHPRFLLMVFSPFALGDPSRGSYNVYGNFEWWENAFAVGLPATILAALALKRPWARPAVLPAWILGVLGLLMALGPIAALPRLLWYGFPGLTLARVPSRFLFLLAWALAVLAGLGAERVTAWARRQRAGAGVASGMVLLLMVAATTTLPFRGYYRPWPMGELREPPPTARWLAEHAGPTDRILSVGFGAAWAQAWRTAGGWRGDHAAYASVNALLRPNLTLFYGLTNVSFPNEYLGAFSLSRRSQLGFVLEGTGLERPEAAALLGLQGVRFVLVPTELSERAARPLRLATTVPIPGDGPVTKVWIYENPKALPRAYFVGALQPSIPERSDLVTLTDPAFDPATTALVERLPDGWSNQAVVTNRVESLIASSRSTQVEVSGEAPGFLVLADTFAPGWQAAVDGKRVETTRTNFAFRGVGVPAGRHTVTFTYAPAGLAAGAVGSTAGGALVLLGAAASLVGRARTRRAPTRSQPRAPR